MSSVTPVALRAAVLTSLGPHTDPRVARIATESVLTIDHDISEWEASSGRVVAHRVRVGLTAGLLGTVRGHPHVEDEITRIMSVAMATSIGDRVSEVVFHYDPRAGAARALETAYRGSLAPPDAPEPSDSADLSSLAAEWLAGFGEADTADQSALMERCLRDLTVTSGVGSRSGRGP